MELGKNRPYLRPKDVAAACGISTSTVYRWQKSGRLPVALKTLGNQSRFSPLTVESLLNKLKLKEKQGDQKDVLSTTAVQ